ncbi:MAG: ATP-dependent zinc metalloprotease FtsH [Candidatus Gracilibacteria bacterium]|nr:ATP-dependent zinc metalloprotease FtsH [Candidatus Gracilibacteria bacterium]
MAEKKIPNKIEGNKIDIKKNNNSNKNNAKGILVLLVISLIITLLLPYLNEKETYEDKDIALNQLEQKYLKGEYKEIHIDGNKVYATLTGSNIDGGGKTKITRDIVILPPNDSLKDLGLISKEIDTKIIVKDKTSDNFWSEMLPTIISFVLFIVIGLVLISRMGGVANNAMTFGKSRARLYDKDKDRVMFKDVAGAEEEKEELSEIVQFLKNPKKFRDIGAKIPRGTLLVGPPGTGKTMLARAVAGESNVPFLSISGSEFVEMFVGVGASRVRDLFENAKKIAPAIIFIDEIDAIGKKRGPGTGGGHDEREQTLNQILTEMDGFNNETNVIVMGATNRADVLDKALLRPGRFDRKITVNLPNLNDRESILKIHASTRKVENYIDFKSLASKTVGFAGADLGNLINEAAILSARNDEKTISEKRINEAFERIVMGLRKKSQVMNEIEKKITAYHEVGHALVGKLLPNTDPVHKVSIVSRGGALGVTWFLPERDTLLVSKAKYIDELATLYGGRAAEEIFFGKENITTGASNDIEKATYIAREMVMRYGMYEEIGRENFAGNRNEGNHLGASENKSISEKAHEKIDQKVKEILDNAYNTAIRLINENKKLHEDITNSLLNKEELSEKEFNSFFK